MPEFVRLMEGHRAYVHDAAVSPVLLVLKLPGWSPSLARALLDPAWESQCGSNSACVRDGLHQPAASKP